MNNTTPEQQLIGKTLRALNMMRNDGIFEYSEFYNRIAEELIADLKEAAKEVN